MADVSYVPGARTAIVGDSCWALIDAPPDSAVVAEIWRRMATPGPLPEALPGTLSEALLKGLIAGVMQFGFGYLPDFVLLVSAGDGRPHLICRGSGSAAVEDRDGDTRRVSGTGLATWLDYPMPAGVRCVAIGEPASETSLLLPASAGIFLASSVVVDLAATGRESRPMPVIAPAPAPVGPPPDGPRPAPAPVSAPVPAPAPAGVEADDPGYDFLFGATQMRSVEDAAIRPDSGGDSLFSFPGDASSFPGLEPPAEWHAPSLEGAVAEGAVAEGTVLEGAVPEGTVLEGTVPDSSALSPRSAPAGWPPPAGGMIESVPWASAAPPLPSQPLPSHPLPPPLLLASPTLTDAQPHPDGSRLASRDLARPAAAPSGPQPATPDPGSTLPPRALISTVTVPPPLLPGVSPQPATVENTETIRRGSPAPPLPVPALADRISPAVQALVCLAGHVSPPNSVACRICAEPLPPQEPVLVPLPVLGILRLSTGDPITLDRSVVMGRNPRSELGGDERPHVVKLPSGDGEISRTHLVVTLDGWHVLVTDLQSTNGTLVELPGRPPERLRPSEPFPIPNGTVVTLADGIYFRFEVAG
jgi:hypothetical protein